MHDHEKIRFVSQTWLLDEHTCDMKNPHAVSRAFIVSVLAEEEEASLTTE